MKKITLLVVLFVACFTAGAQNFKMGNVSKEELMQKVHPKDTAASAAVLYKSGKSYFEIIDGRWRLYTEIEWRIKIYKKDGYEYANRELHYSTSNISRAYFEDAYTYNLVGDKIEKTKLRSDGEIEEKLNEYRRVKKIIMPNIKEGSVIEFRTVVRSPYFEEFPDWYFQYNIPVNNVTYQVSIPEYFNYNRYMNGFLDVKQTPSVKSNSAFGFPENKVVFSATNVQAVKDESHVDNIDNYMAILKHELASLHPPSGVATFYSTDWESLTKTIYENDNFGKELKHTSYFEKDLTPLIASAKTRDEKIAAIFGYVQSRMKWNEYFGYNCDKGVKKAYTEKTGNVADINLMLTAMLRHAGLNANPVLVSTRANGIALYPTWGAYNYVIAAVEIENDLILLDATSKNTLPDILPVRVLNWHGRIIRKTGSSAQVSLMPKKIAREMINVTATLGADGKVTGKVYDQYFDHNALNFREYNSGLSQESYLEKLEKSYDGIEINEYNVENAKDVLKPVQENFTFVQNNAADVIGDKIYFNPLLFFTDTENPFNQEKRLYPVDFKFPNADKYLVNITLPEGYVVESIPKGISLAMDQNLGTFKYLIAVQNNQVQLSVSYAINQASISPEYYTVLRDFYRKMIEKQTEKVVLKKA